MKVELVKHYSPHVLLTPPIDVYPLTNARKNFVPQNFDKFSNSVPYYNGGTMETFYYITWLICLTNYDTAKFLISFYVICLIKNCLVLLRNLIIKPVE